MRTERAGITRSAEGLDGVEWRILGQIYVPKTLTEDAFAWHATLPPGTFVPPHVHAAQDEYLHILDGRFDLWLDGEETFATPGDTVRLPRAKPHGIFNKSGETVSCLFWVAPTGRLHELFQALHDLPEQTPDAVVRVSGQHDVTFLPPQG